jgi:hypothetical protein
MWSTIIPELMTITVWVLTFLCIRAGTKPGYLQDYAVMSINTIGLGRYEPSPLHDHHLYNIYMSTVCAGDYVNTSPNSPLTNFTCTVPSSYCKLTPLLYSIFYRRAFTLPHPLPSIYQKWSTWRLPELIFSK